MKTPERILISRTDSIGDVVLTLPVAGMLKKLFPDVAIIFLSRNYTREVVELSGNIDEWVSWDNVSALPNDALKIDLIKKIKADTIIHVFPNAEIARLSKKAGIKQRIGVSGRLYHYFFCNKIVPLSRRHSSFHEAELNLQLLAPFVLKSQLPGLSDLNELFGLNPDKLYKNDLIDKSKFNLILHPKSKGSAREWPLENYSELIRLLPADQFKIFVTGTAEEGEFIRPFLDQNKNRLTDLTGKFTLKQLISFINSADAMVAASTGPLHLAAILGKLAIGIYPPIRPMHPGRWAPIGKNAHFAVADKNCSQCRKNGKCQCMELVNAEQVKQIIDQNVRKN